MIIFTIIVVYLVAGIIAIGVLDLTTGRIRNRIKDASADTQMIVSNQIKSPVGKQAGMIMTIVALWIYWPVAIGSAIFGLFKKEKNEK